ncbi:radical SAM protein [Candidatus Parcubacteria bacterium]|nr:radical SAM protein [Candidatus Parcubacteria bacterium]
MKAVYGPVSSWRLGRSLGIDLICKRQKACSFDCIYCQLGKTREKTLKRKTFVKTERIIKDLKEILPKAKADVITFSGTGEPTLAKNLEEVIDFMKKETLLPLAILTNSSLFFDNEVQKSLCKLDIIVAKLDAFDENSFQKINQPVESLRFKDYFKWIKRMREIFSGKFALQIMFVNENKNFVKEIVSLAKEIMPDEIQINTPLRPCGIKPLTKREIKKIKKEFSGFKNVISVYEAKRPKVSPIDIEEIKKRKRPKP